MTLTSDATNTPPMTKTLERLTWDQICQRYPDQWVVVIDIERADESDADEVGIEYCTAVVVAHHRTRKGASPLIKEAMKHHEDVSSFFTGRLIPPEYEVLRP